MVLKTLYVAWDGECNPFGIGASSLFLRLGGCHLRCYKTTLGELCDTPEALSREGMEHTKVEDIVKKVVEMSRETGINKVTLTGGDPLWNKEEELHELFQGLLKAGFSVTVETSGTLSWLPFYAPSCPIYWILDYKLKSTGVKNAGKLFEDPEHLAHLRKEDFIKFVVHDEADLVEAAAVIRKLAGRTKATLAVGAYWGGPLDTFTLFEKMKVVGLLGLVQLNMQTHKMALASRYDVVFPEDI